MLAGNLVGCTKAEHKVWPCSLPELSCSVSSVFPAASAPSPLFLLIPSSHPILLPSLSLTTTPVFVFIFGVTLSPHWLGFLTESQVCCYSQEHRLPTISHSTHSLSLPRDHNRLKTLQEREPLPTATILYPMWEAGLEGREVGSEVTGCVGEALDVCPKGTGEPWRAVVDLTHKVNQVTVLWGE